MAALVTLNGLPVANATIFMPRVGVWHAQLALEQLEPFTEKRATLQFGPKLALSGAVRRAGVADGMALLQLLGGGGNLNREARPQAYRDAPLRLPLNDLLQVAEETLSLDSHPEVLDLYLPHWVVGAAAIGIALTQLATQADAAWRVLPDGTFWIGRETWPEAPAFEYVLVAPRPLDDSLQLQSNEPAILPGQSFLGRHVSYIEHTIFGDEVETAAYLEAA